MSWIKKLVMTAAIVTVGVLVLGVGQAGSSSKDKAAALKAAIISGKADKFVAATAMHRNGTVKEIVLLQKENTTGHDHFEWSWTQHTMAYWHWVGYPEHGHFIMTPADYQEFITVDSRGFVNWILTDMKADGVLDRAVRDFVITAQTNDSDYIIIPSYPDGFVDVDWYTPSKDEAEARFDRELSYWLDLLSE